MKLSKKLLSASLVLTVAGIAFLFQLPIFAATGGDEVLDFSQSIEATQLSILNGAGFVDIKYISGSEVKIVATLDLSGGSKTEQAIKRAELVLVPELVNETLLVEAKATDGTNYWTWLRQNPNADKTKINYEIQVPTSIKTVKVYNAVGDVTAAGVKSSLDIEVYSGHITGTSLSPQNYTNAVTYTGNIKMKYSDTSNTNVLKSRIGVGNITVKMPSGANYVTDNSQTDPAPVKMSNVFSVENISRVRDGLLSTQQYAENTTVVANKTGVGTVRVR